MALGLDKNVRITSLAMWVFLGLATLFMAGFSTTGFLELGDNLAPFLPSGLGVGTLAKWSGVSQFGRVAGFILFGYVGLQVIGRKKGLSIGYITMLLVALYLAGGVKAMTGAPGNVLGLSLWFWANFVQLAPWVGQLAGFRKGWAKSLMAYRWVAYIVEFLINLLQHIPYGDGTFSNLMDSIRYGMGSFSDIRWFSVGMIVLCMFAVEVSFVFLVKVSYAIRGGQRPSSNRQSARTASQRSASGSAYGQPSSNRQSAYGQSSSAYIPRESI